jgi:hypothetical protein
LHTAPSVAHVSVVEIFFLHSSNDCFKACKKCSGG